MLFEMHLSYRIDDGRGIARGFQVGMFAITNGTRILPDVRGRFSGWFVDHVPTGLCLFMHESFRIVLQVADAASLACNDCQTAEAVEERLALFDVLTWAGELGFHTQPPFPGDPERFIEWVRENPEPTEELQTLARDLAPFRISSE